MTEKVLYEDNTEIIVQLETVTNKLKNVGVLTSGGDAPGMNAAIRSVVRAGIKRGWNMYGINRGFHGLGKGEINEVNSRSVSEILQKGGTYLMTARSKSFMTEEGQKNAYNMCKVFGLDALVVIGGDGSFRGAQALSKLGIPVIGIPATIDNDIGCSEYTIGYDTAMNTAMNCIDKLKDTASSHERCSVIEVMGRHAGYIAMNVGIATGAEVVLIPEYKLTMDQIFRKLIQLRNYGKTHYVVIVAEGAGSAIEIAKEIEDKINISSRATVLGHLQRGGSPTLKDRLMASLMGVKAIEALAEGRINRLVVVKNSEVMDIDIDEGLSIKKTFPKDELDSMELINH